MTGDASSAPPPGADRPAGPRGDRRRPWLRALFVPVGVLIIAAAAVVVPLPVYAHRPGASLDLTECIVVDAPEAGPVSGDLLLTFATVRRAPLVDLVAGTLSDSVVLTPVEAVVPRDVRPRQHFRLQRRRFDDTAVIAAAVGLDRAGYPEATKRSGRGVRILQTLDGFPADEALQPGDIIIGADGRPVRTSDDLRELILRGNPLVLQVHRSGGVGEVSITPTRRTIDGEVRTVIGATLETVDPQVELPVDVDVQAGRIGGPSAGLMIALDVYDAVADEDLVAGRRIAGTGTIDITGRVGRVGALPLKVMAAARQGASVFVAPAAQAEAARAALPAGSDLVIVGVETIDEAIAALRRLPAESTTLADVRFRSCADRVTGTDGRVEGSTAAVPAPVEEPTMATTAETAERFTAALDDLEQNTDVDAIADLFADEAQIGNVLTREMFTGRQGARDFWTEYRGTFSDLHLTYRAKVSDGSIAVLEWHTTGHLADGTDVDYDGVSVLEIDDGRVTRFTAYFNPRELDPRNA